MSSDEVFKNLSADDDSNLPTEIESLCMQCNEMGITRLLLTQIPFYKEIVLSSFECSHCGVVNSEIQSAQTVQEKGLRIKVNVQTLQDLSRTVVKSDVASVSIPEWQFEIPCRSQKGEVTTIEGILERTITGLQHDQPVRRALDPESANKIDTFIRKLERSRGAEESFTLILDDPSGNSFVENPYMPEKDVRKEENHYVRTREQDKELGLLPTHDDYTFPEQEAKQEMGEEDLKEEGEDLKAEVLGFPTNCCVCNAPCRTNMKVTDIPHFKEVVIMATNCDSCGHRSNEVKSGGGIEPKGKKIKLKITSQYDMSRDLLKSETCGVEIPELDLCFGGPALGGRFTTLEGLLINIRDDLSANPLLMGDSVQVDMKKRVDAFIAKINDVISLKLPATIIMDDPTGNSYLQNIYAPDPDPEMEVIVYDRTFEQNEELGLNDMNTDDYTDDQATFET